MAITRIGNPAIADVRGVNFRNIIINGDMSVSQRGTSTTGLQNSPEFLIDRWSYRRAGTFTSATFSMAQSTDVPTGQGFTKSAKIDCTATESSLPADVFSAFNQAIEGQMLQYLKKGTSNAESLALSFWVKSNKTGTYIFNLIDQDNTRSISKSYTISSANTWEKKTIILDADTTGTLDNDNAASFQLYWYFCAGSNFTSGTLGTTWSSTTDANRAVGQVNLADSTSNEWYVTGIQLETGSQASDFEFLPVDVNLERCFRYYQFWVDGDDKEIGTGHYYSGTSLRWVTSFYKPMRTVPSLDHTSGTNYYRFLRAGANDNFNGFTFNDTSTNQNFQLNQSSNVSGTAGHSGMLRTNNASAYLAFDAEL